MIGVADQCALAVQQRIVHAPGIEADAGQLFAVLADRPGHAGLDLGPQTHDVPMQPIGEADRSIGKAVHFGELQTLTAEGAEDGTATFSTQIDGQVIKRMRHRGCSFAISDR